jgi:hypothetical protein
MSQLDDILEEFETLCIETSVGLDFEKSETEGVVLLSQKEAPQLAHVGNYYRISVKKSVKGFYIWRYIKTGCNAYAKTKGMALSSSYEVWTKVVGANSENRHIHGADHERFELLEYRRNLSERAKCKTKRRVKL